MGKSLYRSYRSKSFDEIVGQDHITETLKNALKSNSISHAYLLSGPRGVGKTSIARILAYAVNDQEYGLEATNLDIIEIDAASNRRIDEIREIRDKVNIAPSVGKYKVYIIDEVHMLTREAFNALLKTLEEPPAHAIFILATTESSKVPETIISRCIRFNFRPIEPEILAKHLKMIAKKEDINISDEAAMMLAEHGRGSFRDAISLLEQVKFSSDKIEAEHVSQMLGLAPKELIEKIVNAIENGNTKNLAVLLSKAYESGSDVSMLTAQLQDYFRSKLLSGQENTLQPAELLSIQKDLLDVPGSPKSKLSLELTLMKYTLARVSEGSGAPETIQNKTKKNITNDSEQKPIPKPPSAATSAAPPIITKPYLDKVPGVTKSSNDPKIWTEFLQELKKNNNTLYGIARMAEVASTDSTLHLGFRFAFHMKQVNESKNKAIFNDLLNKINGSPITITTSVIAKSQNQSEKDGEDSLQNVSNIFGGHEVLES